MDVTYDKRGEAFVMVWFDSNCGNQVGETWLGTYEPTKDVQSKDVPQPGSSATMELGQLVQSTECSTPYGREKK